MMQLWIHKLNSWILACLGWFWFTSSLRTDKKTAVNTFSLFSMAHFFELATAAFLWKPACAFHQSVSDSPVIFLTSLFMLAASCRALYFNVCDKLFSYCHRLLQSASEECNKKTVSIMIPAVLFRWISEDHCFLVPLFCH